MSNLWLTLGGIVVGIVATIIVSRHYFRRTHDKSLVPYLQFFSAPLKNVDKKTREQLQVLYEGREIDELVEVQFLVANTGERSIRDIIDPLTLDLDEKVELLDATMMYISPKGRQVDLVTIENEVSLAFPLLNSGEFFVFKILVNGPIEPEALKFQITAEDLAPELEVQHLPPQALVSKESHEFEIGLFIAGLIITALGLSTALVIYHSWGSLPSWSDSTLINYLLAMDITNWASLVSVLPAFILILAGSMMTASAFTGGSFPPTRRKFVVPNEHSLIRRRYFRQFSE